MPEMGYFQVVLFSFISVFILIEESDAAKVSHTISNVVALGFFTRSLALLCLENWLMMNVAGRSQEHHERTERTAGISRLLCWILWTWQLLWTGK